MKTVLIFSFIFIYNINLGFCFEKGSIEKTAQDTNGEYSNFCDDPIINNLGALGRCCADSYTHGNSIFTCEMGGGLKSIQYTTSDGCDSIVTFDLTFYNPVAVTTIEYLDCNSADVTIHATGGYQSYKYQWSDLNNSILDSTRTELPVGTYSVTVIDARLNCNSDVVWVTVENIDLTDTQKDTICEGEIYTLGGQSFDAEGQYLFSAYDTNGCLVHYDLSLTVLEWSTTGLTTTDVTFGENNGSASVNPSSEGGPFYSYLWSTGSILPTIQDLSIGTYYVTITDAAHCSITDTAYVMLDQPEPLTLTLLPYHPNCEYADGKIVPIVEGGISPYAFKWTNPTNNMISTDSILVNLSEGGYTCEVIDAQNNSMVATTLLEANRIDSVFMQETICENECYDFPGVNDCLDQAGTYSSTFNNQYGCDSTTILTLIFLSDQVGDNLTHPTCRQANGAIDLTIDNQSIYSFNWNTGEEVLDIEGLEAGLYQITITNTETGCAIIEEYLLENISVDTSFSALVCPNSCYTVGDTTICDPGFHEVVLNTADNKCDSIINFTLYIEAPLSISFDSTQTEYFCMEQEGTIVSTITGGISPYVYQWKNENGDILLSTTRILSNLEAGKYFLTVTDSLGCSVSNSMILSNVAFNIFYPQACSIEFSNPCIDEVYLKACQPIGTTGYWSSPDPETRFENGENNETWAYQLKENENTIIWNIEKGACSFSDTTIVFYEGPPIAQDDYFEVTYQADTILSLLANDDLYKSPTEVTIFADQDSITIDEDNNIHFRAPQGFFGMIAFDYIICNTNCMSENTRFCDTSSVQIMVMPYETEHDLPSIITPNGDGSNEAWIVNQLLLNPDDYPNNKVQIYNRWGTQVFYSNPYQNDWKGTNQRGAPLPESTYYYILTLNIGSGEVYKGEIVINR